MLFQRSRYALVARVHFKGPRQCFLGGTPSDPTHRSVLLTHSSTSKTSPEAILDLRSSTPEAIGSTVDHGPGKTHCPRPYFSTRSTPHRRALSAGKKLSEAILELEQTSSPAHRSGHGLTSSHRSCQNPLSTPLLFYPSSYAQPPSLYN